MLDIRVLCFVVAARVGVDHAGDTTARRYRKWFLVYVNSMSVYLMLKKQASCESLSFGSELVAMKKCCECICDF